MRSPLSTCMEPCTSCKHSALLCVPLVEAKTGEVRCGRNTLSRSGTCGPREVSGCLEGLKDYHLEKGFHTIILENVRTDPLFSSAFGLSNPGPLRHPTGLTVLLRESFYLKMSEEKESSDSSVLVSPYLQTELTEKVNLYSIRVRTWRCAQSKARNEKLKCPQGFRASLLP